MPDWRPTVGAALDGVSLDPHRRAAIVEELTQHLDDRYRELVNQGFSPESAAELVGAELENGDALRSALADLEPRPSPTAEPPGRLQAEGPGAWWSDVKYGARALRRSLGLTTVALLTLGLGIGATPAMFSVVNEVLLRRLPFEDPDRLVMFWGSAPEKGLPEVSWPDAFYVHFRDRSRIVQPVAVYTANEFTLTGRGDAERLQAANVTATFFPLLGVKPLLGRGFQAGEDLEGRNLVTVLSHRLWLRRFGGDSAVLGTAITLNGLPTVVTGVMPPGFDFPERAELWVPIGIEPQSLDCWCYDAIGRLAPGRTAPDAALELAGLADQFWNEREPGRSRDSKSFVIAAPLATILVGSAREPLLVLFAGVGMVLLIACANLANLLLARANARARDIAVRCCLGASPRRVVRQLLVESGLLAGAGGLMGLGLAAIGVRALAPVVTARLPHLQGLSIHPMVLLFTLVVTLLTGILFGLAPALRSTRVDLQRALKDGARATGARSARRLNDAFVVAQFAFSLILLTGAGLLPRSFRNLLAVDPGFRPEHVLTAAVSPPYSRYTEPARVRDFQARVEERLRSLPGVRAVAVAQTVPFGIGNNQNEFIVEGLEPGPNEPIPVTGVWAISTEYFAVVGTPLLEGRAFTLADRDSALRVAIVDRTLARRYWPSGSALGQRLRLGSRRPDNPWLTIVGVAGEIKHRGLSKPSEHYVYVPLTQAPRWRTQLAVRAKGDVTTLSNQVRRVVRDIDPEIPVYNVETMEQSVASSLSTERLTNRLLLGFAAVALVLAAIGIYGVMSLNVGCRVGEFGVRMALGASPATVRALVLRHGLRLVVPGVLLGLAGATVLTRFLRSLLFGVKPIDPVTFAAVSVVLVAVAAAACWIPARRATGTDPLTALRGE